MSKGCYKYLLYFITCLLFSFPSHAFSPYGLKCEQMVRPLGIEDKNPRFSWKCNSQDRGFIQGGYRILVSTDKSLLSEGKADMWDSGVINSDQSILVPYGGKPLLPTSTYFWTVKILDNNGNESSYTTPTYFTTGVYGDEDWQNAKWISMESEGEVIIPHIDEPVAKSTLAPSTVGQYKLPQFRKEIRILPKDVEEATAYITGLGHFEFYINGSKVGNHFLDPGWTKYDKEAQYVAFDVTDMLNSGNNSLGVMLGNGFYNIPNERYYKIVGQCGAPKMKMMLKVKYYDGTTDYFVSDESWRVTESPVTYSSIFGGEDYDATLIKDGWMMPGYDDSTWKKPVVSNPELNLYSSPETYIEVLYELPANKIISVNDSTFIYDMGQNFSGIPHISVKGRKGEKVTLIPGEILDDNSVIQDATGKPYYYKYTIGTDNTTENWEPKFTYYGFRYIQVDGAVPKGYPNPDNLPVIEDLYGKHTTSALRENGNFSCSNPLFNKTHELIDWALRSIMTSVLTDCPHREKLGWQEQTHLMQNSIQYRYDVAPLYKKIMRDLSVSQWEDGCVPTIAPQYVVFPDDFINTPEWGSAFVISPWNHYKRYGDIQLLEAYYPAMKKYVDYLGTRADNNIVAYGLGDWYDIGSNPPGYSQLTSNGVTATAIYFQDVNIMKEAAKLLGYKDDELHFDSLQNKIRDSYNEKFFSLNDSSYDRGSQTANSISLALGLVKDEYKSVVSDKLISDIISRNYALTAGDVGYKYVIKALNDMGCPDIIYKMNNRYDVPGYGWQIAHGATALTESWQAYPFVSNNHFMLGHLMEWLYKSMGGVRQSDSSVGFKTIVLSPELTDEINSANVSVNSPYGEILSKWKNTDDVFE